MSGTINTDAIAINAGARNAIRVALSDLKYPPGLILPYNDIPCQAFASELVGRMVGLLGWSAARHARAKARPWRGIVLPRAPV